MARKVELSTGTYDLAINVGTLKKLRDANIKLSDLNGEYAVVGLCQAFAIAANIRNVDSWLSALSPDDIKVLSSAFLEEFTNFFQAIAPDNP